MSEATRITRTVDTDLDADELWALVADGEAWATGWSTRPTSTWRPARPARSSTTASSGRVRIDQPRRRRPPVVASRGGRDDRPELVSAVELVVLPAAGGSRLARHRDLRCRPASPSAPPAWDVRLMLLVAQALAVVRVSAEPDGRRPLDELFAVLADPTRRAVLERLVHDGPQTATTLADALPDDPPGDRQAPARARRRRPRRARARRPRGALRRDDGAPRRRRRLAARHQPALGPPARPPAHAER